VANEIIRTNAVRMIFFIWTAACKHIAFLLLWVRTNVSDCIRTNYFHTSVVFIHSYECICTNTSECIRMNIICTSVISPLICISLKGQARPGLNVGWSKRVRPNKFRWPAGGSRPGLKINGLEYRAHAGVYSELHPSLRPESTGRFWLPCPSLEPGTWNLHQHDADL